MSKQLTIGLFGFGVVGEGLFKVLGQSNSLNATIKKVCIKNADKQRNAPADLFTTNKNELLFDEEINVIVEVIDDADAAFDIVSTALLNGKNVVSASKKMIAEHFAELLNLQEQTERSLLYEAAACASIPVIRNLEEYYDNDLLFSIRAIVNGSTNYILTKIFEDGLDFNSALKQAQELGFAESNPTPDIEGYDAANKWTFLLTHAYGIIKPTSAYLFNGIQNIHSIDAEVASGRNQEIKLVAQAKKLSNGKVAAFVLPQFVDRHDYLAFVKNEFNGIVIESSFADKQFFYGKGAGSFPTASAVLSDISALRYQYKYEYRKVIQHTPHELSDNYYLKVFISYSNEKDINKNAFEWIEEWYQKQDRKYLVGVISVKELQGSLWWKQNGVSLIVSTEPIIENLDNHLHLLESNPKLLVSEIK